MEYHQKQVLFNQFMEEWETEFQRIPEMVKYLCSFSKIRRGLTLHRYAPKKELKERQLEWIGLINQLDDPMDKGFFKPYWVPIDYAAYQYYIDLSTQGFSLIYGDCFKLSKSRWFKRVLVSNLEEFLVQITDPNYPFEVFFIEAEEKRRTYFGRDSD